MKEQENLIVPMGDSGLPSLSPYEMTEQTATRRTETIHAAPLSARQQMRPTLTVLMGMEAGRIVECGDEVLIGRAAHCNVVLPDPGVSRTHVRLSRYGEFFSLEDLDSKNHTFISGRKVSRAEIAPGTEFQIGPNVVLRLSSMGEAERNLANNLYDSSMRDPLTLAFNRRYLVDRLDAELAFAKRHSSQLALLVLDFDHFKKVNDNYGHAAGDLVLRAGSHAIHGALRAEDVLARIGGEEFAIILRGVDAKGATVCAERIRAAVERTEVKTDRVTASVTVSVGVATIDECVEEYSSQRFLRIADERLYDAKASGRNRVVGP